MRNPAQFAYQFARVLVGDNHFPSLEAAMPVVLKYMPLLSSLVEWTDLGNPTANLRSVVNDFMVVVNPHAPKKSNKGARP